MKKIYALVLMAAVAVGAMADEFATEGNGTCYTFNSLSQIEGSGVTLQEDGSYLVSADFTISETDTLSLENNDVIKMGDGVTINVDGIGKFCPQDTALITRDAEGSNPKGFRFYSDEGKALIMHTRFEYVGITFGCANGYLIATSCTFTLHNGKSSSSGAIAFNGSCKGNGIVRCNFIENTLNAIGCGATNPVGITISNNYFYHNTTDNRNKPQINMTCAGDYDMIIRDNTVIGGQFNLSGGIGVSNMMGLAYSGTLTIENNYITENRYGITTIGDMNAVIRNNVIVDNCYESNPMNGGSCISVYDTNGEANIYIEGNRMEGGFWGVTIIGSPTVNMGKVEDPEAEDYNPGNNTFVNNGNNGMLYDVYNNGTSTVYAQGNFWNVETQDEASIEEVIYHQNDDENLGLVIYMPAGSTTGVEDINADVKADGLYYNLMGVPCEAPVAPGIYIHNGKKILVK